MIISVSGLDGSGKSTQVKMLERFLEGRGKDVRTRHLIRDSLTFFLTHRIIGRISGRARNGVEKSLRRKRASLRFRFFSFVRKTLFLGELLYFNLRYLALRNKKRYILICDRYFYDAFVQMMYLGMAGKYFARLYRALISAPDLAFYLEAVPETARERKMEFDMKYFTYKAGLYDEYLPPEVLRIPQKSESEVSGEIRRYVLGSLEEGAI